MPKTHLTNTSVARILSAGDKKNVDASARKLVDELVSLRRERRQLDRREAAIRTALDVLQIRVDDSIGFMERIENRYADQQPFKNSVLTDACLTILADHEGHGLNKNQVETLLTLGGYPFEAKDATNSVEVTLRKLASESKCEVSEPGAGRSATRYRSTRKDGNAVDSRATTTVKTTGQR